MHDFDHKKRQILDRINITDVVGEHVSLKHRGVRWVGLCPFHSEKTPSFTIRPELGSFKCFGCGKAGDVFTFVQLRENVTFVEALQILADRAGVELGRLEKPAPGRVGRAELGKVNAWAGEFFRTKLLDPALGAAARDYLRSRNLGDQTVASFGLGLATDGSGLQRAASAKGFSSELLLAADLLRQGDDGRLYETFRNRLIFPIRDATGRVVGFGGRTLVEDRAKYLNTRQTPLFDKGRGLYGIDVARETIVACGRAVIVEGYTDCLAVHQAGFCETVASLGTALSEPQVELLRRYCNEVIILFDSDEAGESASDRAIRVAFPRCVTVRLARVPAGKDPSEFLVHTGTSEFSDVLKGAVEALEFKWTATSARFQGDSSDKGRREAVLDYLGVIASACRTGAVDVIQRGMLVNRVAHLLGMPSGEVNRLLARLQSEGDGGAPRHTRTGPAGSPPATGGTDGPWAHALGVLLNEPGLAMDGPELPPTDEIADPRERRIAALVLEMVAECGSFCPTDVLVRCQDPLDVERVAELTRRGAERGNYEATLRLALSRIWDSRRGRALSEDIYQVSRGEAGDKNGNDPMDLIQRGLAVHRHFAPRRLIRRAASGTATASRSGVKERTEDSA